MLTVGGYANGIILYYLTHQTFIYEVYKSRQYYMWL